MGWVATMRSTVDDATSVGEAFNHVGKTRLMIGIDIDANIVIHTDLDLDHDTVKKIAEKAANDPIFWSDDRDCHWMFDWKCGDYWCAALFHNNGLPDCYDEFSPLHVRVYS